MDQGSIQCTVGERKIVWKMPASSRRNVWNQTINLSSSKTRLYCSRERFTSTKLVVGGVFTTFVDGTEDGIAYSRRVTFWLISKRAYRGNVTVDGQIIQGRSSSRAFAKRRVEICVYTLAYTFTTRRGITALRSFRITFVAINYLAIR